MRTRARVVLFAAVLMFAALGQAFAQTDEIEIVHIRGSVYLLAGAGANITVSAGPDGVLLVDRGLLQMSDKVVVAIGQIQRQLMAGEPPLKSGSEIRSEL